ncbi:MAG: SPOR domain-containing protein [Bacteroidota bacterium]
MNIEKIIADLLYHYDTVVIPNFGGLVLQSYSAASDQVTGNVQPPSKRLSFNQNLLVDDGLLRSQISQQLQLPAEAAVQVLQNYVADLKQKLETGESITLEGIGHFFQSGTAIQFAAASVNYDRSSYGLPKLDAAIINKIGSEKIAFESTETAEAVNTTAAPQTYSRNLQWLIPVLGILVIGIIIFVLRDSLFSGNNNRGLKQDLEGRIPVNESPNDTDKVLEEDDTNPPTDIEAPTPPPNQKTRKVIVGAFGEKANAEKLARKIQLAGYTPLSEVRNGKRYVGIVYAYEQEAEFERAFADIKEKFNEGAWILTE